MECPYFPMPAFLSPPLVDMSQLFLQSDLPDDDDGRGPAAELPQWHINLLIGSKRQAFACAVHKTPRLLRFRDYDFISNWTPHSINTLCIKSQLYKHSDKK